jgi:hypothetical protein
MNHNFIYAAIGFIIGGLAGGFFMGCYCGKVYKKKIDALEEEIDILNINRKVKKEKELEDREKKAEEHKLAKKTVEDIVGYHEYVAPERKNEEEEEEEEDLDLDEDVEFDDPFENDNLEDEQDEREMIKLISKKAYNEDLQYRDNETLTYYVEDGILADAFDDPIQNAAEIIGIEAIEKAETTDEDEIYVSNDIEDKIYEIVVEHNESYYKDLMR